MIRCVCWPLMVQIGFVGVESDRVCPMRSLTAFSRNVRRSSRIMGSVLLNKRRHYMRVVDDSCGLLMYENAP